MDDFEWIEKDELIEKKPDEYSVQAPEPCDVAVDVSETAHDMPTEEKEVKLPSEGAEDEKPSEEPPVQEDAPREDECLRAMEQELDDDLCVLNIHHLVLLGRIARQLGTRVRSWGHASWTAMRDSLHDGMAEDAVRSHGVSFAAAALTLLVSLLLVHRQDPSSMLSSPVPNSMVSIARSGATCSPLPAAVLALVHNFTAAQSMQESLPLASSVLDAHAKDTKEHFELARSLFRKGSLEKHVHGHRARALQRKAGKELKKTSNWAARELRSLEALHRSFLYDAREAIRLERDGLDMVEQQLPSLVNALSEKDLYVLRRILRSLSHVTSRSEAALEAMRGSYKGAAKGVAYVGSALDSHWERVGAALQTAVEGELASRKASLEALALSSCLPSLEEQLEGETSAPITEAPCALSAMDALISRLHATLAFQQRLLRLIPAKANVSDVPGQHRTAVAACERSGGLAIALQRRHADLAALTKLQQAATAA